MANGEFGLVPWRDTLKELKNLQFYRDVLCEATISMILLFIDVMMATQAGSQLGLFIVGVVSGLYVYLLIEAFGHVQGALQNPVVTLSFVCTKRLSPIRGICYIAAQIGGGTAGGLLCKLCLPVSKAERLAAFSPGADVEFWQAGVIEGFITAGLIVVTLGALDERLRTPYVPGLPIGLALTFGIIAAGDISGGVMNPCIATSFANVAGDYSKLWLYWVSDYAGGIIAIFLYWFYTYRGGICEVKEDEHDNDSVEKYTNAYAE